MEKKMKKEVFLSLKALADDDEEKVSPRWFIQSEMTKAWNVECENDKKRWKAPRGGILMKKNKEVVILS